MSSSEQARDEEGLLPEKVPVAGVCPECGAEELRAYPVVGVGGWFQVVKCQRCLCSVSREPWTRLGWITLVEETQ